MHKKFIVASIAALLLNACVVAPAGRGPAVVVAPPLPTIVELDEPYYYYRGYYYYYDNSRWRYANSRSGPWVELPRSHYPNEIRYKGRGEGWRGDDDRDRHWDRGDDRRYDRDDDRDRERRRNRDKDRRRDDDDDDQRWDRRNDRGG